MSREDFTDDDIEIIYWGDDEEGERTGHVVDSMESLPVSRQVSDRRDIEKEEKFDLKREVFSWIKVVLAAVIIAIFIDHVLIVNAEVPTGSMENTIMTGSRMIGWRWSYKFDSKPQHGDVIIFKYPDDPSKNYVKRVVGIPGDTVEIRKGLLYVNGVKQNEDYVVYKDKDGNSVTRDDSGDFEQIMVPENSYFVLGDNRNNSWDSRYWTTTHFVPEENILGKAILCYWYNGPELDILK